MVNIYLAPKRLLKEKAGRSHTHTHTHTHTPTHTHIIIIINNNNITDFRVVET